MDALMAETRIAPVPGRWFTIQGASHHQKPVVTMKRGCLCRAGWASDLSNADTAGAPSLDFVVSTPTGQFAPCSMTCKWRQRRRGVCLGTPCATGFNATGFGDCSRQPLRSVTEEVAAEGANPDLTPEMPGRYQVHPASIRRAGRVPARSNRRI